MVVERHPVRLVHIDGGLAVVKLLDCGTPADSLDNLLLVKLTEVALEYAKSEKLPRSVIAEWDTLGGQRVVYRIEKFNADGGGATSNTHSPVVAKREHPATPPPLSSVKDYSKLRNARMDMAMCFKLAVRNRSERDLADEEALRCLKRDARILYVTLEELHAEGYEYERT